MTIPRPVRAIIAPTIAAAWLGCATGPSQAAESITTKVVAVPGPAWPRHTIDDASRGADGVKLGDLNGDRLPDIVTGWEEGAVVRVCLNPGPDKAAARWPSVVVGRAKNVEEAIFADLDGDGRPEIVSGTEGATKTMFQHRFVGNDAADLLDPAQWKTDPFPTTAGAQLWMQAASVDLDGRHGPDLLVGSKSKGAAIGWLEAPPSTVAPPSPDDLASWRYHQLRPAGWIMSLAPFDLDADGDSDAVFSDRTGNRRGVAWLENPGPAANQRGEPWPEHPIGAAGRTVMFADIGDLNGDRLADIVVAAKPVEIVVCLQQSGGKWNEHVITLDGTNLGDAKAVKLADLDGDGLTDIVFTCENASGPREGIVWLRQQADGPWQQHSLGGPEGVKFDLIQTLDLDADGDLDVLTCEERDQLGVVWYENPSKSPK